MVSVGTCVSVVHTYVLRRCVTVVWRGGYIGAGSLHMWYSLQTC